jgi:hypothetical protein
MTISANTRRVLNQKYGVTLLGFADRHEADFGADIAQDIREAASIIAGKTVERDGRKALLLRLQNHVDAIGCLIGHTAKEIANWRLVMCSLVVRLETP